MYFRGLRSGSSQHLTDLPLRLAYPGGVDYQGSAATKQRSDNAVNIPIAKTLRMVREKVWCSP